MSDLIWAFGIGIGATIAAIGGGKALGSFLVRLAAVLLFPVVGLVFLALGLWHNRGRIRWASGMLHR